MDKHNTVHSVREYYSATKKNKLMKYATTLDTEVRNVMLSERSYTKENMYFMIPLI